MAASKLFELCVAHDAGVPRDDRDVIDFDFDVVARYTAHRARYVRTGDFIASLAFLCFRTHICTSIRNSTSRLYSSGYERKTRNLLFFDP